MKVKRNIQQSIGYYTGKYPIIGLTGPRQSGKTTLLRELFSDYRYVSLEKPDIREYAENDANAFLKEFDNKVILDEIQQVPKLFSYLQTKVDEDRLMGQYIISGSQNFKLKQSITQSLSGRIALFKLFPFDFVELQSANWLNPNPYKTLLKGFYPAIFDRQIPSENYYSNYIETYIERDVADILNIANKNTFQKFITLCAANASQIINMNNLAKKCGVSQPTIKSWLSVLQSSYIIFLLPPYFSNLSKRAIKSPKLYFYDTGLLSFLLGLTPDAKFQQQEIKGHLFENMIVSELIKQNEHFNSHAQFYFWRNSNQKEIDLIIENKSKTILLEIKSTATIQQKLFKNLLDISGLFPENLDKILIYAGDTNQKRNDVSIVSWNELKNIIK